MKQHLAAKWYSLTRKLPVYWVLIIALLAAIPYNLYINHFNLPIAHNEDVKDDCNLPYNLVSDKNNRLIHPILFADVATEDEKLMPLKEKINIYLNTKKAEGLTSAAVYFNNLNNADGWFVINPDEKFNPASMIKIAFMIAILKEAEENPAILDKKVFYAKHSEEYHDQAILQHQLPPGKYYTIRELLQYAVSYSDNDAAFLILNNFKWSSLQKLIAELNLPPVELHTEYFLTAEQMSRFFRILYNGSYLSNDLSEYALTLLTKSDFNKGLIKNLDKNLIVARKFGERGIDKVRELHEYGIIYLKGNTYLIGIMTRGKDYAQLQEIIAEISVIAYDEMAKTI